MLAELFAEGKKDYGAINNVTTLEMVCVAHIQQFPLVTEGLLIRLSAAQVTKI